MTIIGKQRDLTKLSSTFLPKSSAIVVQKSFLEHPRYESIINPTNLSALDNYLAKENAVLRLDILNGDLFHSVKGTIRKKGFVEQKSFVVKLDESKDKFVQTMRNLYINVENALKSIK